MERVKVDLGQYMEHLKLKRPFVGVVLLVLYTVYTLVTNRFGGVSKDARAHKMEFAKDIIVIKAR